MAPKLGELKEEAPVLGDEEAWASDRRREYRLPIRLEVRFSVPSQAARALRAYSLNFSLGGLCLKPHRPCPVGSPVQLALQIGSETLELEATVAWVRDGAIGVRFVNLSDEGRTRLLGLVDRVAE